MTISREISARLANGSLVAAVSVVVLHVALAFPADGLDGSVRLFLRDAARFAVPWFFLVSGFLLAGHVGEPGWWRRETLKRLRTLGVPYLLWSAIFGLFLLVGVAGPCLLRHQAFDLSAWWDVKKFLLFGLDLREPPLLLPCWYLRTLLILVFLSGILVWFVRRTGVWALVVLGGFYLGYTVLVDLRPSLTTGTMGALLRQTFAPEAFFYFTLGLWLRQRDGDLPTGYSGACLAVAGIWLVARACLGPWVPYPLVIPFVIAGFWSGVPGRVEPNWLAGFPFPIYLTHWFFVQALSQGGAQLKNTSLFFVFALVLTLAGSLGVSWTLRRWFPRLSGVLFGGR